VRHCWAEESDGLCFFEWVQEQFFLLQ
jgi:hypothetical protein